MAFVPIIEMIGTPPRAIELTRHRARLRADEGIVKKKRLIRPVFVPLAPKGSKIDVQLV